ncbi:hypothetical protein [Modestobacter altitudinis]|uniref:hypothetical protein n=1 Tax=Modestobacter altitudinis TaxID=2213158 RepID=UPI00110D0D8A|nr:hypothetical protein [Modestobacter altitudinis]
MPDVDRDDRAGTSDVDVLVWGTVGAGALAAVTMLALLVSGHESSRGFLAVFAVPLLALAVVAAGRRLAADRGPGADEALDGPGRDDGAAEPGRLGD